MNPEPVNAITAAGRSTAVAAIRALANDSETDWDALTALLNETGAEVLRATVEELALLFVAVARPSDELLAHFGMLAATAGEAAG